MPKMRGFLRTKEKIDDAEWAIAQIRTAARLEDLFSPDEAQAAKQAEAGPEVAAPATDDAAPILIGPGPWPGGPRPPIIVVGVSDVVSVLGQGQPGEPVPVMDESIGARAETPPVAQPYVPIIIGATAPTPTEPTEPARTRPKDAEIDLVPVMSVGQVRKPAARAAEPATESKQPPMAREDAPTVAPEAMPARPIGLTVAPGSDAAKDLWRPAKPVVPPKSGAAAGLAPAAYAFPTRPVPVIPPTPVPTAPVEGDGSVEPSGQPEGPSIAPEATASAAPVAAIEDVIVEVEATAMTTEVEAPEEVVSAAEAVATASEPAEVIEVIAVEPVSGLVEPMLEPVPPASIESPDLETKPEQAAEPTPAAPPIGGAPAVGRSATGRFTARREQGARTGAAKASAAKPSAAKPSAAKASAAKPSTAKRSAPGRPAPTAIAPTEIAPTATTATATLPDPTIPKATTPKGPTPKAARPTARPSGRPATRAASTGDAVAKASPVRRAAARPVQARRPTAKAAPARRAVAGPSSTARPAKAAPSRRAASRPPTRRTTAKATAAPVRRSAAARVIPAAHCPYCALLLDPAPTINRRCDRCRQKIVVRHVDGHAVFLTEGAVSVFEAERERIANLAGWTRQRDRWLTLAANAGASPERQSQLARARLTEQVVIAARALYMTAIDKTVRAAKRENRWDEASRIRREQAAAMYRVAGAPRPLPADLVAAFSDAVAAELRGIAEISRDAELVAANCCETCRADDGVIVRISQELRTPRLPHAGCPRGLCRCRWDLAARDRRTMSRYLRRRPGASSRSSQGAPVEVG